MEILLVFYKLFVHTFRFLSKNKQKVEEKHAMFLPQLSLAIFFFFAKMKMKVKMKVKVKKKTRVKMKWKSF